MFDFLFSIFFIFYDYARILCKLMKDEDSRKQNEKKRKKRILLTWGEKLSFNMRFPKEDWITVQQPI